MLAEEIEAQFQRRRPCAAAAERGRTPAPHDAPIFAARRTGFSAIIPEWLAPHFSRAFGDEAVAEGRALAVRAPLDLRVNALKATRPEMLAELAHLGAQTCRFAPLGLRIPQGAAGRGAALDAEPAYARGMVEIQDEGSQLASAPMPRSSG